MECFELLGSQVSDPLENSLHLTPYLQMETAQVSKGFHPGAEKQV